MAIASHLLAMLLDHTTFCSGFQAQERAYLPKITSKSLEDSFTEFGSRSVLGFFQSLEFFLFSLDAHFKVSVCLSQMSHM